MTPASPNTYVVSKEPSASDGFTREPIIGFAYDPKADKPPTVVTLQGQRRILGDTGVLFPCGTVVDPLAALTFEDIEEWLAFTGKSRPKAESKTTKPVDDDDEPDSVNDFGYDIEWTNKSFKNNSFWHYDDGTHEFVFILPGEEDAPKQTEKMMKIKRTDLDALKKNIDLLPLAEVKSPDVLPDADPEEDDEDDDDDGLI